MAQRYALVIGISNYHRSLGNLTKPATDAQAVARCLQEYGGFQVTLLAETLALETLRQTLKQFLLEQANGNDALIYFTGHGILLESITGYRETFLAASDTEIIRQARKPMEPLYSLPFGELNSLIQQSSLSSLVLLLDCCHSGDMLERDPVERALTAFNSTQRNYCFITACRSFEESRAKRSDDHSLFTGALLQALSPPTRPEDDRTITSGLLFYRLSQSLKGSGQEALHLGWGNDISIAIHPALPKDNSEPALNLANPYIGLASFDSATAQYFYGREEAVRALQARLLNCRVLTVFGPSGCGKSSLVKAGLLPELRDRPFESTTWQVEMLTPTAQPLENLGDRLKQRSQSTAPFILFIDQFEELFTLCDSEAEQRSFIQLMTTAIGSLNHLKRIVIAIRGDFLDRCAKIPESATLINRETELTTYMVTHLSAQEMAEAIERPAAQQGARFEMGLVPQIIADVGNEPGALPLLQYALTQLWDLCIQPDSVPILTFQGYEQIGGVQGALKQRADQLYRSLHPDDQGFTRQLLMELVQLGDGQEVTRRKAHWEKLRAIAPAAQLDRVVARLTQERLIVTDEKTVEVAHEALLSEWTLLKTWIEENRENIRLSRRLESDCHDWQEKERSQDFLLSAGRLAAIQEWVAKEQPKLTQTETEFLNQSIEKRDREIQSQLDQERKLREEAEGRAIAEIGEKIEAERREKEALGRVKAERQKNRIAAISGVALAVLAAVAGVSALWAQAEKQNAQAKEIKALVAYSEAVARTHDQLGALRATVKVLKQLRGRQLQTPEELQRIIAETQEVNRLEGHTEEVNTVSFSPDGTTIASGGFDGSIKIWDQEGKLLSSSNNSRGNIQGVTFSLDSKTIASVGLGETIRLWDIKGNLIKEINPQPLKEDTAILAVKFSPDSKIIATGNYDKYVKLWRVSDGKLLKSFQQPRPVYGVSFSPNGQIIASASTDKTVRLWRVADGKLLKIFYHGDQVEDVSFSPDGQMIASASWDKSVRIWRISDGKELKNLQHKSKVFSIDFSPNGQMLASGDEQGINIWKLTNGKLIKKISGHSNSVNTVNFNRKNNLLISASDDKTVRIWNLEPNIVSRSSVADSIVLSCNWMKSYLKNNLKLNQNERQVCDDT